jgi:RNA polymerase sigma-70 factor (ECF subfamily)
MSAAIAGTSDARTAFDRLVGELRPKLHRYCARMTGSVTDGEDVVQEALVKAIEAFPRAQPIAHPEGWIFRIAHNAALDFLRRRNRLEAISAEADLDTLVDPATERQDVQSAAASLRTFMRLPVAQRSSVVLMDVLGYSLQEIGAVLDSTIPAVKAALHRGRARLQKLAREPDDHPVPTLAAAERARLALYLERFNARDFDSLRDMLADDVRLDLVGRTQRHGRHDVATYFHNYSRMMDWRLAIGLVEGRPAVLVFDPERPSPSPAYFVLLEWDGERISGIRDFRYARYAVNDAEMVLAGDP